MSPELGSAEQVMGQYAPGSELDATFLARTLWPDRCETGHCV